MRIAHFLFLGVLAIALALAEPAESAGQDSRGAAATENPEYVTVKRDGLYGYITPDGTVTIEPQFDYAEPFFEGLAAVRTSEGKWGYIDRTGAFAIAPAYGHASHFGAGLGFVEIDGKFGFIDRNGDLALRPQFDGGGSFNGELTAVLVGEKWGYIDTAGRFVIEPAFDGAEDFHEGLARICDVPDDEECFRSDNRKFGFIDKSGRIVVPARFDYAEHFSEGLAMAQIGERYGFIDKSGQWAIEPVYTNAGMAFADGLVQVTTEAGAALFIDTAGKTVLRVPEGYLTGDQFSDGLVLAMDQAAGKWGFMDVQGNMAIAAQYDRVMPFRRGVAPAMANGKWGLIDTRGEWLVEPGYDRIGPLY